jgi:hypothetical protein
MPAKQTALTDAERRKRIIEAAREAQADNDPAALDRALKTVVKPSALRSRPSGKRASS